MRKRFPFFVTVVLMLLICVGVPFLLIGLAQYLEVKQPWWDYLSVFSYWFTLIGLEFVSQYGPQPMAGPLTRLSLFLTNTRDRLIFVAAIIIGYVVALLPKSFPQTTGIYHQPQHWVVFLFLGLALLIAYGICFLLGTGNLRQLLAIRNLMTSGIWGSRPVTRGEFPHERQSCLVVGQRKPESILFDPRRIDFIVSELEGHAYRLKSTYIVEDHFFEFRLYRFERGRDKLFLQAENSKGIRLFGPADQLEEFYSLAND